VLVQQPGERAQNLCCIRGRQHRADGGELVHPEGRHRIRIRIDMAGHRREPPQRLLHPRQREVDGRGFLEIDPPNAQMVCVMNGGVRQIAALEGSREFSVRHRRRSSVIDIFNTIMYYTNSVNNAATSTVDWIQPATPTDRIQNELAFRALARGRMSSDRFPKKENLCRLPVLTICVTSSC